MQKFIQNINAILTWADLVRLSAPWAGAEAHLYTNDVDPNQDTIEADMVEATFAGYAALPITWGAAYMDAIGQVVFPSNNLEWICTAAPGESLYGIYILGDGGELLGALRFSDAPRTVTTPGTGLSEVAVAAF